MPILEQAGLLSAGVALVFAAMSYVGSYSIPQGTWYRMGFTQGAIAAFGVLALLGIIF